MYRFFRTTFISVSAKMLGYVPVLLVGLVLPGSFCAQEANPDSNSKKTIEILVPQSGTNKESDWEDKVMEFQDLDLLGPITEENSKKLLEESASQYNEAVEGYNNALSQVEKKRKEFSETVHLQDRYDWQKKARKESEERVLSEMLTRARRDAIAHLVKGINTLDKIQNSAVQKDPNYLKVKAGLFREYIKHQYSLHNFLQAVDFLERYLNLGPEYNKETEPHKILAHCYSVLQKSAEKYNQTERADFYHKQKNKHFLLYVENKYGRDSEEYKRMSNKLYLD